MSERPLWAPWRMQYVSSAEPRACIFCDREPQTGEQTADRDRERLIVHRGKQVLVFLNRYPYAPGHLMVAPVQHTGQLAALPSEARAELMQRIAECAEILEDAYGCQGMNIGANFGRVAGAGFADHVHFHVVPRWEGDTNFMTVIGELRVIPKHLERIYQELFPRFAELGP